MCKQNKTINLNMTLSMFQIYVIIIQAILAILALRKLLMIANLWYIFLIVMSLFCSVVLTEIRTWGAQSCTPHCINTAVKDLCNLLPPASSHRLRSFPPFNSFSLLFSLSLPPLFSRLSSSSVSRLNSIRLWAGHP